MDKDPTMKATLKVQSKNNIIEAGLRKRVEGLQRECEVNLSQIDHERLDTREFLKQIHQCTTDDLPESKHWLGNRTPSGNHVPRTTRLTFRNQSAPTNMEQEEQTRQADLQRPEHGHDNEVLSFRSLRPKPELVQRTMALQKLFSRRNLYAGMGQAWDVWGLTGFSEPAVAGEVLANKESVETTPAFRDDDAGRGALDLDNRHVRSLPDPDDTLEKRRESRCRTSHHEDRNPRACRMNPGLRESNGKSPNRPQSELKQKLQKAQTQQQELVHECGRPGYQGHHSQGTEDFMKELLVRKSSKRRRKKAPLQERINAFFERMDMLKEEERKLAAMPSQIEMHRRWLALTKGVKVALAESSEEDEPKGMHTG